jgi:glycosyltransferase involved in cell wall biosynthesis
LRILQINTTVNSGSTGRIAEDIGRLAIERGHESYIAYGRGNRPSASKLIKIGNIWDVYSHVIKTSLFDRHGFGSTRATHHLVKIIKEINPDIIHLHNIHGYYLNVEVLFDFLKEFKKPVVWTFHDCWPFTGHCSYFDRYSCFKWQTICKQCPNLKGYPSSWFIDNSTLNFNDKKRIFNGLEKLVIVTPSLWLANHLKKSFLKDYPVRVTHNGIDLKGFDLSASLQIKEKYGLTNKAVILGVASVWDKRKGLADFIQLSARLTQAEQIVLVGLSQNQMQGLPDNITGISRTEDLNELTALYSIASVFVNPTYIDNFPTTNIEALACGTPVITYNTGGSPEAVDEHTGRVVPKGDIQGLLNSILELQSMDREKLRSACRTRALENFDKDKQYLKYLELYNKLLNA